MQGSNTALPPDDLTKLTFAPATLVAGQIVPVDVTATVGTGATETTDTKILQVTLARNLASIIIDKIIKTIIPVSSKTNPDTTDPATITAIQDALQKENPGITNEEKTKISFSNTTLTRSGVSVIATATVGADTATKTIRVYLLREANEVKAKITDKDIDVPAGTNPDVSNAQTQETILTALQAANSTLTGDELKYFSFGDGQTLVTDTKVSIFVYIFASDGSSSTLYFQVTLLST